jgi:hypothetical protein
MGRASVGGAMPPAPSNHVAVPSSLMWGSRGPTSSVRVPVPSLLGLILSGPVGIVGSLAGILLLFAGVANFESLSCPESYAQSCTLSLGSGALWLVVGIVLTVVGVIELYSAEGNISFGPGPSGRRLPRGGNLHQCPGRAEVAARPPPGHVRSARCPIGQISRSVRNAAGLFLRRCSRRFTSGRPTGRSV